MTTEVTEREVIDNFFEDIRISLPEQMKDWIAEIHTPEDKGNVLMCFALLAHMRDQINGLVEEMPASPPVFRFRIPRSGLPVEKIVEPVEGADVTGHPAAEAKDAEIRARQKETLAKLSDEEA